MRKYFAAYEWNLGERYDAVVIIMAVFHNKPIRLRFLSQNRCRGIPEHYQTHAYDGIAISK
jgi:hypothetical protein